MHANMARKVLKTPDLSSSCAWSLLWFRLIRFLSASHQELVSVLVVSVLSRLLVCSKKISPPVLWEL
eukprot:m.57435 g.57435  ORF g.57435 m.57435 type:complete len:67 (+) comp13083_c0_seq1:662-862(+)